MRVPRVCRHPDHGAPDRGATDRAAPGGLAPGPRAADGGFTLVETLVALAILTVTSLGLLYGILAVQRLSGDGQARVTAASIAAEALDAARLQAETDLDAVSTSTWQQTVGTRTFTVLQSATWQPGTGSGSACDSGVSGAQLYKRVSVRVTWPNMGVTEPVRSDTLISPGVGAYDPDTGNLAVKVLSADGTGQELVEVSISGPSTETQLTDEDGCAFFDGLPEGAYTAAAAALGLVDADGVPDPSTVVGVLAGETVSAGFDLDEAATVEAELDPTLAAYPPATGTALSLGHPSLAGGSRWVVPATWPGTLDGAYPFPSGYAVWLGTCDDANPDGVTEVDSDGLPETPPDVLRVWEGADPPPVVAVTPGGTATVTVPGAAVEVTVTDADTGLPLAGAEVRALHAAETGTGCTAGEDLTLGLTAADGTVRATLPFGRDWQLVTTNASATPVVVTLDPSDTYPVLASMTAVVTGGPLDDDDDDDVDDDIDDDDDDA